MFGRFLRRLLPSSKTQVTDRFDEMNSKLDFLFSEMKELYTRLEEASDSKIEAKFAKLETGADSMSKDLNAKFEKLRAESESRAKDLDAKLQKSKTELDEKLSKLASDTDARSKETDSKVLNVRDDLVKLKDGVGGLERKVGDTLGFARENNWGIIFNNAITGSDWLTETNFSLVRWAIGYQCAYVLFRVLNEVKPKKILELGLGQSTKLISQYVEKNADVDHTVFESNPEWIDFFKLNYNIPENTRIEQSDWVFMDYDGVEHIRVFDGFDEKIKGKKFDLVVIDAPLGGDMPNLARIDVLRNLPGCLEKSFVILIDDMERSGEKNTFERMKNRLKDAEIEFSASLYWGKKAVGVITSEDLKFVCSM